jgi:L-asparagine oxygenase
MDRSRTHDIRPDMDVVNELHERGHVDLGHVDLSVSTLDLAGELATVLGAQIFASVDMLETTAPGTKPLNTYGGNYARASLPLHTDLAHWAVPPRYLILRCIVGSPDVATHVVHHREIARRMPEKSIDRALLRPRRRLDGRMFLLRMRYDGIFRWDSLFLEPDNAEAREVRELFADEPACFERQEIVMDRPGKALLIDNWTVLHGRSAVPPLAVHRRLERVYLEDRPND